MKCIKEYEEEEENKGGELTLCRIIEINVKSLFIL